MSVDTAFIHLIDQGIVFSTGVFSGLPNYLFVTPTSLSTNVNETLLVLKEGDPSKIVYVTSPTLFNTVERKTLDENVPSELAENLSEHISNVVINSGYPQESEEFFDEIEFIGDLEITIRTKQPEDSPVLSDILQGYFTMSNLRARNGGVAHIPLPGLKLSGLEIPLYLTELRSFGGEFDPRRENTEEYVTQLNYEYTITNGG